MEGQSKIPIDPNHLFAVAIHLALNGDETLLRKLDAELAEARHSREPPADPAPTADSFQRRVDPWLIACFGEQIARDQSERSHRFLEEALELVQAAGCSASEAHQLVDYTYGRPVGELPQEVGGVMVTLAALCLAHGVDMHGEAETELARILSTFVQIRAKQAAKQKYSPLPATPQSPAPAERVQPVSDDGSALREASKRMAGCWRGFGQAEGCCSACSPCSHQKRDPYSICEVCQKAAAIGVERNRIGAFQEGIAQAAAERAGSNTRVAPELLYAPILWAIRDATPSPPAAGRDAVARIADRVVRNVCELPDRTSPDDWPEAMLVTGEELHALIMQAGEDDILALTAATGDRGWQPIETAPKWFQPSLVAFDRGKHGDIARAPAVAVWSDKSNLWVHWHSPGVVLSPQPTHWRPLPAPPACPSTPDREA